MYCVNLNKPRIHTKQPVSRRRSTDDNTSMSKKRDEAAIRHYNMLVEKLRR